MELNEYLHEVETELLMQIDLYSENPFDPIVVRNHSTKWKTIGNGNYAAVFVHEAKPEWVVKVYGRNPEELQKEVSVYEKLGNHKSFSRLYAYGERYLILKRLEGITLFNALIRGVKIPESVIRDVDHGLAYARSVGLNPYDIHGKNVVMNNGRGYIVDVSDFYKSGYDSKWNDLKKAYYRIYKPFIRKWHPPIPFVVVDGIRRGYRFYKRAKRKWKR
ncbi:serine/threonine protein kinase [Neobacillus sp. SM06]|uniref:serine/threonine protein kinase n=1 Tax=Neobacillus sp. SM06 TaxID=3422492 RepID=UPI003D26C46B